MHTLSEAELSLKIRDFRIKKDPEYAKELSRFPERQADARKATFLTRISEQYLSLVGHQAALR